MTPDFIVRLITTVGYIIIGASLYRAYLKTRKMAIIKYFSFWAIFSAAFQFITSMPAYICLWLSDCTDVGGIIGISWIIGEMFLWLSKAMIVLVVAHLGWPKFKRFHFAVVLAIGIAILASNIVMGVEGVYAQNTIYFTLSSQSTMLIGIMNILSTTVAGIYFLVQAFRKSLSTKLRLRSLIIGIAFLFGNILGPAYMLVKDPTYHLLIMIGEFLAVVVVAYTVLFIKERTNEIQP